MLKELFNIIEANCLATNGMLHAAEWNQQLAFIDEEEPFGMPTVFVEISPIAMKAEVKQLTFGNLTELRGTTTVTLHLLTAATDGPATAYDLAEALAVRFAAIDVWQKGAWNARNMKAEITLAPCHDHAEVVETLVSFELKVELKTSSAGG